MHVDGGALLYDGQRFRREGVSALRLAEPGPDRLMASMGAVLVMDNGVVGEAALHRRDVRAVARREERGDRRGQEEAHVCDGEIFTIDFPSVKNAR